MRPQKKALNVSEVAESRFMQPRRQERPAVTRAEARSQFNSDRDIDRQRFNSRSNLEVKRRLQMLDALRKRYREKLDLDLRTLRDSSQLSRGTKQTRKSVTESVKRKAYF